MHHFGPRKLQNLRTGLQHMRVYKLVGLWAAPTKHFTVQRQGHDHGGVKVDVWRDMVVENAAGVSEVRELDVAEANKLECVELGLAVTKCCDEGLELFEMVQVGASFENCQDLLVQIWVQELVGNRDHSLIFFLTSKSNHSHSSLESPKSFDFDCVVGHRNSYRRVSEI
ncbi:hypothetical protein ACOSQ4_011465 [Xanthoceras sorbifolium]